MILLHSYLNSFNMKLFRKDFVKFYEKKKKKKKTLQNPK